MGCCGQKRTNRQNIEMVATSAAQPRPAPTYPVRPGVKLCNMGETALLVRGPTTGRTYGFARSGAQIVDPQDALALLRTRHFQRCP